MAGVSLDAAAPTIDPGSIADDRRMCRAQAAGPARRAACERLTSPGHHPHRHLLQP
jgi:hypothetical protein